MEVVLFITPAEVRERTSLDSNVDENKIINTIILAQDITLEPLLGSVMFDDIKAQVIADTLTAEYRTLIDQHMRKVLTSTILHKISMFLIYRYNNTGVVKNDIDKEAILSIPEIRTMRNEVEEYVGVYGQRLTAFLEANLETYPLYNDIVAGKVSASKVNPLPFYNG
jgi:hypothetical protein